MGTTTRGYPYLEPTAYTAEVPEYTEALAEAIDADVRIAMTTADLARVSTTTETADPTLTLTLPSQGLYILDGLLMTTDRGGRFKCNFGAVWAQIAWSATGAFNESSGVQPWMLTGTSAYTPGASAGAGASAKNVALGIQGRILTVDGGTPTVTLQWAQYTSSADATDLMAGSYLRATRVT